MGNERKPSMYVKHTIHNFSSYVLSGEEYKALYYGLDHHILISSNYNAVETEFELFYHFIKYFAHSWKRIDAVIIIFFFFVDIMLV